MRKYKGGSGYEKMFKETLSPCYDNVKKVGWHGGKKSKKNMKGGELDVPTYMDMTPSWYNQGEAATSSKAVTSDVKINEYQFTRTLPNNQLYTASALVMDPSYGSSRYPLLVAKGGGKNSKNQVKNKNKNKLTVTVGKDGKKYYFKGGKRVSKSNKF
jgi:hypothetical protein